MKTYVADTHSLIWRLCVPSKLSSSAKSAFDEVDRGEAIVLISAVVVAEMLMVALKRRIPEWTEELPVITRDPAFAGMVATVW